MIIAKTDFSKLKREDNESQTNIEFKNKPILPILVNDRHNPIQSEVSINATTKPRDEINIRNPYKKLDYNEILNKTNPDFLNPCDMNNVTFVKEKISYINTEENNSDNIKLPQAYLERQKKDLVRYENLLRKNTKVNKNMHRELTKTILYRKEQAISDTTESIKNLEDAFM